MATSDTYILTISDAGVPSAHAATHQSGGSDPITISLSQVQTIATDTVLGNISGTTAAPTAVSTTGTGSVVRATDPTLTLTNATALPLTTGVTGILPVANGGTGISSLAAGVATFLGTPTSANLNNAVTDQTGSGALVFGTGPTISSPYITGVPSFASPLSAASGGTGVTSLGAGIPTFLETPTSDNLLTALTDATGQFYAVFSYQPTLDMPTLIGPIVDGAPVFTAPLSVDNGGTGVASKARGQLHFNSFASPVTLSSVSSSYKQVNVGSPLTLSNATNVILGTTNTATLKNTSGVTRFFRVSAHINFFADIAAAHTVGAKLYKGLAGSHSSIDGSEVRHTSDTSVSPDVIADVNVNWIVELANNEEVSLYLADFTGTADVKINFVKMVIDSIL